MRVLRVPRNLMMRRSPGLRTLILNPSGSSHLSLSNRYCAPILTHRVKVVLAQVCKNASTADSVYFEQGNFNFYIRSRNKSKVPQPNPSAIILQTFSNALKRQQTTTTSSLRTQESSSTCQLPQSMTTTATSSRSSSQPPSTLISAIPHQWKLTWTLHMSLHE